MNKYTITIFTVLILLCFAAQFNGQTTDQEMPAPKTAYALLHRDFTGPSMAVYFLPGLTSKEVVSVLIYKSEKAGYSRYRQLDKVNPCPNSYIKELICIADQSDSRVKMIYNFPPTVKTTDKFRVWLKFGVRKQESITDDSGNTSMQERLVETSDVLLDIREDLSTTSVAFDKFTEADGFKFVPGYDPKQNKPNGQITVNLTFKRPDDVPEELFNEYVQDRMDEIYAWANTNVTKNFQDLADIDVESLAGKDITYYDEKPVGIRIAPPNADKAAGKNIMEITFLIGKKFPLDKFHLGVDLKNAQPLEFASTVKSAASSISSMEVPDSTKVGSDDTLGLREFKSTLDLGVAIATSVEDEEDEQGEPIRKRNNFAYGDVRFAPWINRPKGKTVLFWPAPIFLDAKVSNKKIDKDSLSLNRIIIGTDILTIKHLTDSKNRFIYSFRGLNTSDRDFKQIEGKFNFEFRPQLNILKKLLITEVKGEKSKINDKVPRVVDSGEWFGYKIEPFVGFEIGRVYRQKRKPFENEENSRNIRRLFFGLDMQFDLTKYFTVKLFDTFYVRGESSDARYRNYFKGEILGLIKKSANTSQHLFVSFEKGDDPPFVTRSVNAFKAGYRINTNFWSRKL